VEVEEVVVVVIRDANGRGWDADAWARSFGGHSRESCARNYPRRVDLGHVNAEKGRVKW